MLRSMTGFGKGEASFGEGQHLVVEVSSKSNPSRARSSSHCSSRAVS